MTIGLGGFFMYKRLNERTTVVQLTCYFWYRVLFRTFSFFYCIFPMKRSATLEGKKLFQFALPFAISDAFLISRSGTSPKSESGVVLPQFITTWRIIQLSSRRRMWPVPPPVSCSHCDFQRRFEGHGSDSSACNSLSHL